MIARIFIPLLLFIFLPDLYIDMKYLRQRESYSWWKRLFWWIPCIIMEIYTTKLAMEPNFVPDNISLVNVYIILMVLFVCTKVIFTFFSLIGSLWCRVRHTNVNYGNRIGILFAVLSVAMFTYGTTIGFNKLRIAHIDVYSQDIPQSFDGYKIVHFSDAHVGTYIGCRKQILLRAIDSIKAQNGDMIVFTGDLQNLQPSEIYPFQKLMSSLKAKDGVYSVLGNHDYSDYMDVSKDIMIANNKKIKDIERQFGWNLLLNENKVVRRGSDSIVIAGEENFNKKLWLQRADLNKTLAGVKNGSYVVMLQHNPLAWRKSILPQSGAQLTLCGHTHGGQLSLFGLRPTELLYSEDFGLYKQGNQSLYVTAGLGGVVPFRIGATGEIAIITLHRQK